MGSFIIIFPSSRGRKEGVVVNYQSALSSATPCHLFKLLLLITLGFQINHFSSSSSGGVSALILSVGDKCDTITSASLHHPGENTVVSNSNRELEIINGTIFGFDPPICDPSMPGLECSSGRCQCKKGFTISRNGTRCLEIARNGLDSQCEESIQCWKGLLGRLSECRRDSGRCRCYESETLPIVFHQGRCYYGESLGDFCQIQDLCSETVKNAECRTTCQCKEGYIPSWDKSRCLQIAVQGLNSSCEENIQCEKSALGTLSECNQAEMKCQCYQIPMVPSIFYAGRCYFGAALGNECQVNPQCISKTEHSICGKDGKCACDDGYVSNHNQTACLQIPSADGFASVTGSSDCVEDIQCTKALGHFARCNALKKKCECYVPQEQHYQQHYGGNKRENETTTTTTTQYSSSVTTDLHDPVTAMVIIGSRCHSAKHLGQGCKFNKQCSATTASSVCYNGICECREESHVPSTDGRKCLEIGTGMNSQCDEDQQCQSSNLGPLSKCNSEKKKCECSSVLPVVYYDKKCYFHRQLGSPCLSHKECVAGGNFFAECLGFPGRCSCKNGTQPFTQYSCIHSSSASTSFFPLVILWNFIPINPSLLASLIAILCLHLF